MSVESDVVARHDAKLRLLEQLSIDVDEFLRPEEARKLDLEARKGPVILPRQAEVAVLEGLEKIARNIMQEWFLEVIPTNTVYSEKHKHYLFRIVDVSTLLFQQNRFESDDARRHYWSHSIAILENVGKWSFFSHNYSSSLLAQNHLRRKLAICFGRPGKAAGLIIINRLYCMHTHRIVTRPLQEMFDLFSVKNWGQLANYVSQDLDAIEAQNSSITLRKIDQSTISAERKRWDLTETIRFPWPIKRGIASAEIRRQILSSEGNARSFSRPIRFCIVHFLTFYGKDMAEYVLCSQFDEIFHRIGEDLDPNTAVNRTEILDYARKLESHGIYDLYSIEQMLSLRFISRTLDLSVFIQEPWIFPAQDSQAKSLESGSVIMTKVMTCIRRNLEFMERKQKCSC